MSGSEAGMLLVTGRLMVVVQTISSYWRIVDGTIVKVTVEREVPPLPF
ncbi:hypothetical protein ACO1DI_28135 [Priestia sp. 40]